MATVARDSFLRIAVPLFTLGIPTYFWGGRAIHSMSESFSQNLIGGAGSGLVEGVADAVGNAAEKALGQIGQKIQDGSFGKEIGRLVTQNFQSFGQGSGASNFDAKLFGEKIADGFKDFLDGTGVKNTQFDSKKFGETIGNWVKDFLDGTGVKNLNGQNVLADLVQSLEQAIRKADFSRVTGALGEQINGAGNGFLDGVDIGDMAERLGDDLNDGLKRGTQGVGQGLREAVSNTLGQVVKGITFDIAPYAMVGIGALVATPLVVYYLYRKALHNIGRPKLATEIHQRTIFTPITERIGNVASYVFNKDPAPVYSAEVTRRIDEIIKATQNIRSNGGYFQNVLFYGPGGTGKTMISEFIAKNSGMSYIKMSGGDLAQYIKRGEHVTELNKLMDKVNLSWRPWSSRPWIFFIDEAESLCRDRDKIPSAELLELQNAFLNRTGTQSKKCMIILSTNRMEDLDEAVLSRMDHKIHIGPPALSERARIIDLYAPHFFSKGDRAEFFTKPLVHQIAENTNGLTGRALFKLLNAIANKKACTQDAKLTQPLIDETVKDFVDQEKETERRRLEKANKLAGIATPSALGSGLRGRRLAVLGKAREGG